MYMYGWVPLLSPETIKTLLIGYTPIQNKKIFKNTVLIYVHTVPLNIITPQILSVGYYMVTFFSRG